MSTSYSQIISFHDALAAAVERNKQRQAIPWPTNEQVLRTLRRQDRSITRVLVDEPTGLGLYIRSNALGGWSSSQFKINTPEQLAYDGELLEILPPLEVSA